MIQHLHGISEVTMYFPVPGAYSLLNLDKGQICQGGEILGC